MLQRGVEDGRIGGREDDWERPLPALDQRARRLAGEHARVRIDFAQIVGAAIEPGQKRSVVAAGVENVRIQRIWSDVARLGAARAVEGWRASSTTTTTAAAGTATPGEVRVARHADRAA